MEDGIRLLKIYGNYVGNKIDVVGVKMKFGEYPPFCNVASGGGEPTTPYVISDGECFSLEEATHMHVVDPPEPFSLDLSSAKIFKA